ncbi:MAG: family 16 glycoside hydrolase [Bacteroidota bacterium]
MIKKISLAFSMLILSMQLQAQKNEIKVPMTASAWEHDAEKVEFVTHNSVPAVRSKTGEGFQIQLKNHQFTNGTLEFDVEFTDRGFPGIGFRSSDDQLNTELFYIRYFGTVDPLSRYTMQYATVIDGVNMWDMTDEYQAAATIYDGRWNHVKLVVSGKQMKVYVNDMDNVALHVPALEGNQETGGIYLSGSVIYANLVIQPNATEGLTETAGYDPTYSDTRYLKHWKVNSPIELPFNRDIFKGMQGDVVIDSTLMNSTEWKSIKAERRGMVNLTRRYGATEDGKRRLAWVKTNIKSETDQVKRLKLGFSDEVWVFIDGQPLFVDKNYYGSPGMKAPRGRCTIANSEIMLPLKKGDNELLLGIANYFFGWGFVARLDSTDGLQLN